MPSIEEFSVVVSTPVHDSNRFYLISWEMIVNSVVIGYELINLV